MDNFGNLLLASSHIKTKPKGGIGSLIFGVLSIVLGITRHLVGLGGFLSIGLIVNGAVFFLIPGFLLVKKVRESYSLMDIYDNGIEIHMGTGSKRQLLRYGFDEIYDIRYTSGKFGSLGFITKHGHLSWKKSLLANMHQVGDMLTMTHARYLLQSAKNASAESSKINFSINNTLTFYMQDGKIVFSDAGKQIEANIKDLCKIEDKIKSAEYIFYFNEAGAVRELFRVMQFECTNIHVLQYILGGGHHE